MNSIEIDVKLGGTDRCNTIVLESWLYVAMSPSNLESCTYKIVKKTTFFLTSNETPVKNNSFWSFLSFATFYWTFLNLIRPLDWLLEHYLCYYLSHIDTANGIWIGNRRILAMICKKCPTTKSLNVSITKLHERSTWAQFVEKILHLFMVLDCSWKPLNFSIYTRQKLKLYVGRQSPFSTSRSRFFFLICLDSHAKSLSYFFIVHLIQSGTFWP